MLPDFKMKGLQGHTPDVSGAKRRVHVFGRSPAVDVQLQDATVSELHAAIVRDIDGVWVFDLGSRNLVRVGRQVTRRQRLADGNRIDIGPFSWRISISGKPAGGGSPRKAVLLEQRSGRHIELSDIVTTIGRRRRSRIRLDDDSVSRLHALLIRTGDGLLLRNLSRRTGTRVNGQRLEETLLQQGDVVQIGKATFEVDLSSISSVRTGERGHGRGATLAQEIESALGEHAPVETPPPPEQVDQAALDDFLVADEADEAGGGAGGAGGSDEAGGAVSEAAEDEDGLDLRIELPDEDFGQPDNAPSEQGSGQGQGKQSGVGRKSPANKDLNDWLDELYSSDESQQEKSSQDDNDEGNSGGKGQ